MPSKKAKQKIIKHHICSIARVIACVSFLILTIIGVSSIVRAMSLEEIANENGIPASWKTASLGNPDTITVPISYWDQRQESCMDDNRQFEWSQCQLYTTGALQGVVKNHLGADGLPIPAFTNSTAAWNANKDIFTMNVTGNDPVQPTDNFYRWFHETSVSKRYDREVTFVRKGNNTYTYGSKGIFPLDDVDFSNGDDATKSGHNFHFTSHLRIPVKIAANGQERFDFMGDDDVWVFLNGKLVLDIGGLHQAVKGHFVINADGTITTYVDSVAQAQARAIAAIPSTSDMNNSNWRNQYLKQVHNAYSPSKTKTIDIGLEADQVVNLDFFYAERSTSESNTEITITNMNWPISADSGINAKVVGQIGETKHNLVQFVSSITNRDPENPLDIERISAYIEEVSDVSTDKRAGFLPLSSETLYYTATPGDVDSWQPVDISAPENSMNGFKLNTPLRLAQSGMVGDTLYFRYFGESSSLSGNMASVISYYTSIDGTAGVTYDRDITYYQVPKYNISIKYLYEDGSEAAPTYVDTLPAGKDYSVSSPEIENYQPDVAKVVGVVQNSDIEYVVYYKTIPEDDPTPDVPKHTVTIKYVYENGGTAAESHTEELEEGSEYAVTSPKITDYEPDQEKVSGTIADEDVEHIVVYRKTIVSEPGTPDGPIVPAPVAPTPPSIPSSDIIDDNLIHLDPLGQVAFVPNTGLIDSAATALFGKTFADIILSQGFVLVTLFVFASSFAIYFSLRKFMKLESISVAKFKTANLSAKKPTPTTSASRKAIKDTRKSASKTNCRAKSAKVAAKKPVPRKK